jgi:hypothetical protein
MLKWILNINHVFPDIKWRIDCCYWYTTPLVNYQLVFIVLYCVLCTVGRLPVPARTWVPPMWVSVGAGRGPPSPTGWPDMWAPPHSRVTVSRGHRQTGRPSHSTTRPPPACYQLRSWVIRSHSFARHGSPTTYIERLATEKRLPVTEIEHGLNLDRRQWEDRGHLVLAIIRIRNQSSIIFYLSGVQQSLLWCIFFLRAKNAIINKKKLPISELLMMISEFEIEIYTAVLLSK